MKMIIPKPLTFFNSNVDTASFFVLFQQSEKSGYFMFINTRSEDFFWYCGYASDLSSGSKVSSLQQQHFEYLKKFFHEIILEGKI